LFETKNLKKGFEFSPRSNKHLELIRANSRSYAVENVERGSLKGLDTIKIVLVEINYKLIYDRTKKLTSEQPQLKIQIRNRLTSFDYNLFDVEVNELVTLDCK
jgi:hypothetical protein